MKRWQALICSLNARIGSKKITWVSCGSDVLASVTVALTSEPLDPFQPASPNGVQALGVVDDRLAHGDRSSCSAWDEVELVNTFEIDGAFQGIVLRRGPCPLRSCGYSGVEGNRPDRAYICALLRATLQFFSGSLQRLFGIAGGRWVLG